MGVINVLDKHVAELIAPARLLKTGVGYKGACRKFN